MQIYAIPLLFTGIIAIALAIFSYKYPSPYKVYFVFLMLAIADWSFGYAMELASIELTAKLFWTKIQYFGIVSAPIIWLAIVLQYIGRGKLITKRNLILLSIIPAITILLVWTNDMHHLIWRDIKLIQKPFLLLDFTYGLWAEVHTVYAYVIVLLATFWLIHTFINSYHIYRKQAGTLMIASFAPLIGNALYVFDFSDIDLTPFGFLISGIAIAWSFLRFHLLDVMPIARNALIENMRDGVIALNKYCHIISANPSAQKIIGYDKIGKSIDELTHIHPKLADYCHNAQEMHEEITLQNGKNYEMHLTPLYDGYNNLIGYLLILHDITERKKAEEELRKAYEKIEKALEREKEFKLKTAHYFLNPLCVAKGYLELMKEEGGKEDIDKVIEAIERIERVIQNIIKAGEIKE